MVAINGNFSQFEYIDQPATQNAEKNTPASIYDVQHADDTIVFENTPVEGENNNTTNTPSQPKEDEIYNWAESIAPSIKTLEQFLEAICQKLPSKYNMTPEKIKDSDLESLSNYSLEDINRVLESNDPAIITTLIAGFYNQLTKGLELNKWVETVVPRIHNCDQLLDAICQKLPSKLNITPEELKKIDFLKKVTGLSEEAINEKIKNNLFDIPTFIMICIKTVGDTCSIDIDSAINFIQNKWTANSLGLDVWKVLDQSYDECSDKEISFFRRIGMSEEAIQKIKDDNMRPSFVDIMMGLDNSIKGPEDITQEKVNKFFEEFIKNIIMELNEDPENAPKNLKDYIETFATYLLNSQEEIDFKLIMNAVNNMSETYGKLIRAIVTNNCTPEVIAEAVKNLSNTSNKTQDGYDITNELTSMVARQTDDIFEALCKLGDTQKEIVNKYRVKYEQAQYNKEHNRPLDEDMEEAVREIEKLVIDNNLKFLQGASFNTNVDQEEMKNLYQKSDEEQKKHGEVIYRKYGKEVIHDAKNNPNNYNMSSSELEEMLKNVMGKNYDIIASGSNEPLNITKETPKSENSNVGFYNTNTIDASRLAFLKAQVFNPETPTVIYNIESIKNSEEVRKYVTSSFSRAIMVIPEKSKRFKYYAENWHSPIIKNFAEFEMKRSNNIVRDLNSCDTEMRRYLAFKMVYAHKLNEEEIKDLELSIADKEVLSNTFENVNKDNQEYVK